VRSRGRDPRRGPSKSTWPELGRNSAREQQGRLAGASWTQNGRHLAGGKAHRQSMSARFGGGGRGRTSGHREGTTPDPPSVRPSTLITEWALALFPSGKVPVDRLEPGTALAAFGQRTARAATAASRAAVEGDKLGEQFLPSLGKLTRLGLRAPGGAGGAAHDRGKSEAYTGRGDGGVPVWSRAGHPCGQRQGLPPGAMSGSS